MSALHENVKRAFEAYKSNPTPSNKREVEQLIDRSTALAYYGDENEPLPEALCSNLPPGWALS